MGDVLAKLSDKRLLALHWCAKDKMRPFFTDPHNMIALRSEIIRRGLTPRTKADNPQR